MVMPVSRDFGGVGGAVWGLCAVRFVSGDGVAQPHVSEFELARHGQAEAMAILIRRTLTRTKAPSFSSFSRIVPQVASANCVCANPMRRRAQSST